MNDLIPVSDEQARAVQETAKAVSEALGLASKGGSYIAKVLGDLPRDIVGLVVGDYLKEQRVRNLDRLATETKRIRQARNAPAPEPISPTVLVPLLTAAADESRPEIASLFAKLLAAASDPATAGLVRRESIETVRQFEPLDAKVLAWLRAAPEQTATGYVDALVTAFGKTHDEISVSVGSLKRLACVDNVDTPNPRVSAYGRELLRACDS